MRPKTLPQLKIPIAEGVSLAQYTTIKIGGPARFLAQPSMSEMGPLLQWACSEGIQAYVIGRGSNIVVDSDGLDGLVILTRDSIREIRREADRIVAGAGVSLPRLSKFAAAQGLTGYEFLIGIPGTVGGGVVMNAGLTVFRPREISDILQSVKYLDEGFNIVEADTADLGLAYRSSSFQGTGRIVLEASFKLTESGNPAEIHAKSLEHLKNRKGKQPLDMPTAGSTFKQPIDGKPAGWYIEQAGLKGTRVGYLRVSTKHANWLVNEGGATSDDARALINIIKDAVLSKFGVLLELELQFLSKGCGRRGQ